MSKTVDQASPMKYILILFVFCMSARDPARGQPAEGMIGEKWRISLLKKIYVIGCFTNMKSGTFKSTIKYNFDIL